MNLNVDKADYWVAMVSYIIVVLILQSINQELGFWFAVLVLLGLLLKNAGKLGILTGGKKNG